MTVLSFVLFLLVFVMIGSSAVLRSRNSNRDYYVASGQVSPFLVGLSAVATNNSGYMFIGAIGYTYVTGLASVWLMVGWILGDFVTSLLIHKKLRQAAGRTGEVSYAGVLSQWLGKPGYRRLQVLAATITILFLLAYASAQLLAGSKALQALFEWPLWAGAVIGATIVVIYCIAGGIRASIWTDAAQSTVMMVAMASLLFVAVSSVGGISGAVEQMSAVDGFLDWYPAELPFPGITGGVLFAVSWLFAGISVIGQPHIMIRFMALDDPGHMVRARMWYYGWFTAFYAMAIGVGLLARIFLDNPATFDEELALPMMAQQLMPPVMVGLILAGIFAATMSTADSLILSCSAALSHDLLPHQAESTAMARFTTVLMTAAALLLTFTNSQSVFALVIMAWSVLASAFAPLLIVYCSGGRPRENLALMMVLGGVFVALTWRWLGLHDAVYEGMPGILSGLLIFAIASRLPAHRSAEKITQGAT
ncbi:MAG: sodium/proline symporter [Pseudohongiellaceae bacterium]